MFSSFAIAILLRLLQPIPTLDHRYTLSDMLANNPYTAADWQYEIERRPESKTHHCTCTCACKE